LNVLKTFKKTLAEAPPHEKTPALFSTGAKSPRSSRRQINQRLHSFSANASAGMGR
jgi:hypothetical protein